MVSCENTSAGARIASATPPPIRQPTLTRSASSPRQERRRREHRPGDDGDHHTRPQQLAAHDRRRLHRPGLQQLEVPQVLAHVDAQHLRRQQDREHRRRRARRRRACDGQAVRLAPSTRPTSSARDDRDHAHEAAGRPCAASASPPSTRTPSPAGRRRQRPAGRPHSVARRRLSGRLLAAALGDVAAASWNASSLSSTHMRDREQHGQRASAEATRYGCGHAGKQRPRQRHERPQHDAPTSRCWRRSRPNQQHHGIAGRRASNARITARRDHRRPPARQQHPIGSQATRRARASPDSQPRARERDAGEVDLAGRPAASTRDADAEPRRSRTSTATPGR